MRCAGTVPATDAAAPTTSVAAAPDAALAGACEVATFDASWDYVLNVDKLCLDLDLTFGGAASSVCRALNAIVTLDPALMNMDRPLATRDIVLQSQAADTGKAFLASGDGYTGQAGGTTKRVRVCGRLRSSVDPVSLSAEDLKGIILEVVAECRQCA